MGKKEASVFVHSAEIIFNLPNLDENRLWHVCSREEEVDLFSVMSHQL